VLSSLDCHIDDISCCSCPECHQTGPKPLTKSVLDLTPYHQTSQMLDCTKLLLCLLRCSAQHHGRHVQRMPVLPVMTLLCLCVCCLGCPEPMHVTMTSAAISCDSRLHCNFAAPCLLPAQQEVPCIRLNTSADRHRHSCAHRMKRREKDF
jgi:hypothetical protein